MSGESIFKTVQANLSKRNMATAWNWVDPWECAAPEMVSSGDEGESGGEFVAEVAAGVHAVEHVPPRDLVSEWHESKCAHGHGVDIPPPNDVFHYEEGPTFAKDCPPKWTRGWGPPPPDSTAFETVTSVNPKWT
jgi:hypothetical protein